MSEVKVAGLLEFRNLPGIRQAPDFTGPGKGKREGREIGLYFGTLGCLVLIVPCKRTGNIITD